MAVNIKNEVNILKCELPSQSSTVYQISPIKSDGINVFSGTPEYFVLGYESVLYNKVHTYMMYSYLTVVENGRKVRISVKKWYMKV